MKLRKLLLAICILFLAILVIPSFAKTEPIEISVAYPQSPTLWKSTEHTSALVFQKYVESKSEGRLKVNLFPGGQLGSVRDVLENVSEGLIEVTISGIGSVAMYLPEGQIFGLPYLFPDENVAWKVLDGDLMHELSEKFIKSSQIRILGLGSVGGFRQTTNSVRPIHTVDDWKNLKIRTMNAKIQMQMVEELGGSPTPISWLETYEALRLGVASGQLNSLTVILEGKIYETQKYLTLDNHVYAESWICASEKFMQSLPEDLQKIVIDGAYQGVIASRGGSRLLDAVALEEIGKHLEVYTPTKEEMETFKQAVQPVYDWLAKEIDPYWIDKILGEVKKYSN